MSVATRAEAAVERVDASAYTIPTDAPESDGTLEWDSTTIVVVELEAGGERGLGYTYTHAAAAQLIADKLADVVVGRDALDVAGSWHAMSRGLRNIGRPGLGFMALSAVDLALWDLKARLTGVPLVALLEAQRDSVPVYGSGGFCSYSDERLRRQLSGWVEEGIPRVKMKVGREPERDPARVAAARDAIGSDAELYVDANGAFDERGALELAAAIADARVTWFEEPVSSDELEALHRLRVQLPREMEVAAGEYGDTVHYFRRMLEAAAVDVLQADVTRCGGITGLLAVAELADAHGIDLSAHCAPAVSAHAFCAVDRLRHLEWFHDHVRVEAIVFDGLLEPVDGALYPDRAREGNGLELKRQDAERWRAS